MEQEFEEREGDIKEAIQRFEQMLDQQQSQFFDLDVYEQLVEHYLNSGDLDKALNALAKQIGEQRQDLIR